MVFGILCSFFSLEKYHLNRMSKTLSMSGVFKCYRFCLLYLPAVFFFRCQKCTSFQINCLGKSWPFGNDFLRLPKASASTIGKWKLFVLHVSEAFAKSPWRDWEDDTGSFYSPSGGRLARICLPIRGPLNLKCNDLPVICLISWNAALA